jgi:polyisoprenoid-binding protein YceI
MRRSNKTFVLAQLALAPALMTWPVTTNEIDLQPESKLWVEGTSSVRGYRCNALGLTATLRADGGSAVQAILAGEKAVSGADLTIDAARLECGNGTMNGHMRKALKAEASPPIEFKLGSYDLSKSNDTLHVQLNGDLTIGGTQKAVTIAAVAKDGGDGALIVEGTHELRMTE